MPDPGQPPAPRPPVRPFAADDVRFTIPGAWEDRSVIMLLALPAAPGGDGAPAGADFSVTLHRDVPEPDEDLAAYVARQLARLERGIADLDVLREGTRVVGGLPAREAEFRWTEERGRLRQHQVYVLRDGPGGRRVLTWTATAPATHYHNHVDAFAALLDSVHFAAPTVRVIVPGQAARPAAG